METDSFRLVGSHPFTTRLLIVFTPVPRACRGRYVSDQHNSLPLGTPSDSLPDLPSWTTETRTRSSYPSWRQECRPHSVTLVGPTVLVTSVSTPSPWTSFLPLPSGFVVVHFLLRRYRTLGVYGRVLRGVSQTETPWESLGSGS